MDFAQHLECGRLNLVLASSQAPRLSASAPCSALLDPSRAIVADVAPGEAELSPIGVALILLLVWIDWQAITECRWPWLGKTREIQW